MFVIAFSRERFSELLVVIEFREVGCYLDRISPCIETYRRVYTNNMVSRVSRWTTTMEIHSHFLQFPYTSTIGFQVEEGKSGVVQTATQPAMHIGINMHLLSVLICIVA